MAEALAMMAHIRECISVDALQHKASAARSVGSGADEERVVNVTPTHNLDPAHE
jgi:hypothetical protein